MQKVTLLIEDMSCMHCVNSIQDALSSVQNVSDISVDLDAKTASFAFDTVSLQTIIDTLDDIGFEAKLLTSNT